MTKRRSTSSTSTTQRAAVTGISGVVIIVILLIAQLVGIDVLHEGGTDTTPAATSQPTTAPVPTPVSTPVVVGGVTEGLVAIPGGYNGGWFQVYFTQPSATTVYEGSPLENALIRALDGANQSIDAALYEMNSRPVTDALIRAKNERGVVIRVVTDGDAGLESPDTTITDLELADIPVVSDGTRGAQMHNKFIIIDQTYVWTGSTNLTQNGIYKQNNNAMLIRSSKLAENYMAEFEELFSKKFGVTSPTTIPNPVLNIDGTQVETFFESEGDVPKRLSELITNAHSVRFMAFAFTEHMEWKDASGTHSVMDQLINQSIASRQFDVKGIIETSSRQQITPMYCAGLDVRQDGNPQFMHHKVFIIDESMVVIGSFNFSDSAANSNDENVLIIHNAALAQAYLEEFERLWAEAQPIPASALTC